MESKIHLNSRDLKQELAWLARVLDTRFKLYFDQEPERWRSPAPLALRAMLESANDSMAQVRGAGRWLSR